MESFRQSLIETIKKYDSNSNMVLFAKQIGINLTAPTNKHVALKLNCLHSICFKHTIQSISQLNPNNQQLKELASIHDELVLQNDSFYITFWIANFKPIVFNQQHANVYRQNLIPSVNYQLMSYENLQLIVTFKQQFWYIFRQILICPEFVVYDEETSLHYFLMPIASELLKPAQILKEEINEINKQTGINPELLYQISTIFYVFNRIIGTDLEEPDSK